MSAESIADGILRIAVGLFFIPHGFLKFGYLGGSWEKELASFARHGLTPPKFWVPLIGVLQISCGALLALGIFTREIALVIATILLGSALTALARNGWYWHDHGVEYALFWMIAALIVAIQGSGAFALM